MSEPAAGPIRAYVDTSVFGGVFDEEFAEHSRAFFSRVASGSVVVLVGQVTELELDRAPEHVRAFADSLNERQRLTCTSTPAVEVLIDALSRGVRGE